MVARLPVIALITRLNAGRGIPCTVSHQKNDAFESIEEDSFWAHSTSPGDPCVSGGIRKGWGPQSHDDAIAATPEILLEFGIVADGRP